MPLLLSLERMRREEAPLRELHPFRDLAYRYRIVHQGFAGTTTLGEQRIGDGSLPFPRKLAVPKIKATQNGRNRFKVQYKSTVGISLIF